MNNYVEVAQLARLNVKKPSLYIGTIASGDLFVQDVHKQKNLYAQGMHTLAVEMEGAAVAQVCNDYSLPYALVRIISDKANDSAHASLEEFSVKLASHYASGIVQEILKQHLIYKCT
jgi:adenosylhomocysteine nucleosidase